MWCPFGSEVEEKSMIWLSRRRNELFRNKGFTTPCPKNHDRTSVSRGHLSHHLISQKRLLPRLKVCGTEKRVGKGDLPTDRTFADRQSDLDMLAFPTYISI